MYLKKEFKKILSLIVVLSLYMINTLLYAQGIKQEILANEPKQVKPKVMYTTHIKDTNNIGTYRGKQTIVPLMSAVMIQSFGVHRDPIYHIKIFYNALTLKPTKYKNVQAVFDGKVLFAGKKSGLGYVVILKHSNNILTIYARLDHIAFNVKPGVLVKKASSIGLVSHTLLFQVVQDNKYINPMSIFIKRYIPINDTKIL